MCSDGNGDPPEGRRKNCYAAPRHRSDRHQIRYPFRSMANEFTAALLSTSMYRRCPAMLTSGMTRTRSPSNASSMAAARWTGVISPSRKRFRAIRGLTMIPSNLEPVSYTHLDVYKRQVLVSLLAAWFVRLSALPVSGTCFQRVSGAQTR